ncbi:MAG: N-acetylglucosamine-6-phosphate deacetylase [Succinivibrio sp.]|jgi:N-acetylglucosamine-6-phosphate deacetylase|nr:N-acetylglucosamine-6-phosphate deacetylase [Succinivibrio sp.]
MLIKNGLVFTKQGFEHKDIKIEAKSIKSLSAESADTSDAFVINADDCYVLPGFIDLHFHGAAKVDFMDGTLESVKTLASYEASHGVTSIAPATMTMPIDAIKQSINSALEFNRQLNDCEASLEGIYMEGPFVSPKKLGAQNPEYVLKPNAKDLESLYEVSEGLIKKVVIAPEEDGALDLIKSFHNKVSFSIGHTVTDYETATAAMKAGANELTHTFNAMPPLNHRAPGPIGAAFENKHVFCELITDGVHVDKTMVNILFSLMGDDRIVMISDSMMATGLDDGEYSLGGQKVFVKGNRATLKDGTIAGSVTNLYSCFVNAVQNMGVSFESAIKACTINPARALKIDDKVGEICEGKRADLLVVDKNLEIKEIVLRGKILKRA